MCSYREKGLVRMSAVIPEINLSVNVGKNVVGDGNFSPEKGGNTRERIANEVVN